ncbi:hypothetical protein Q3G72_008866 [Acer saccharum]|nr:hypothetical protein Q3G72_008866 [Acer saccharum]
MSQVPVKIGDKWTVDRDPDEKSYYVADVTDELMSRNTSVSSSATPPIELDLVGVTLLDGPQVQQVNVAGAQRTYIVVFLGPAGTDMPADALRDLDGLDEAGGVARGVDDSSTTGIITTPENVPEPISLVEAKAHLRVVVNDDDDYIASLIIAARQMAEGKLNRSLVRKSIQATYDSTDSVYWLRKPPVLQVTAASTLSNTDGTATALGTDDFYTYGIGDDIMFRSKSGATWPNSVARGDTLSVTYEAGYAAGAVPRPITQWMLLCIGTMYENRETMAAGVQIYAMPEDFQRWLLQPYMVYE